MEQDSYILTTKDLEIGYKTSKNKIKVAKNINLNISEGNLIAIVGANGMGKSTLLRTLAKQQPKLGGDIKIYEREIKNYNPIEFAKLIAWVPTHKESVSNISVYDLVSLGRQPYTNWIDKLTNEDKKYIEEAISLTQLNNFENKKCSELSDGQLQRVFIARALSQNTPIILLDEPTTHLDIAYKIETLSILKDLCIKSKKTILYTTHEIELSIDLCNSMVCLLKDTVIHKSILELIDNKTFDLLFKDQKVVFDVERKRFFKRTNI